MNVEFNVEVTDNSDEVLREILRKRAVALETIGLVAEGYAKRLCPVDTGRLRGSISHTQMNSETEVIGTNVEYAPYVELGTVRTNAQPYLRPAIENHIPRYVSIIKRIMKE